VELALDDRGMGDDLAIEVQHEVQAAKQHTKSQAADDGVHKKLEEVSQYVGSLTVVRSTFSGNTALFAVATGFPALVVCRGTMGLSQAGLFPCAMGTIKTWFPETQRALAQAHDACMGAYADILTPGILRQGDQVRFAQS
jgi:hypothetical protein